HHSELNGGADAVKAGRLFEGRSEVCDVAHNEKLAWAGVEDGRRVHAAVGAGDDERPRRLSAVGEISVQAPQFRPARFAVDPVAFDQVLHRALQANLLGRVNQARNLLSVRRVAMKSFVAACAAALLAASCATAPDIPSQRERLTRQIADDAVGFNEAYAQAVSAQILLNI